MEEKKSRSLKALNAILSVLVCFILLAGPVSQAIAGWEEVPQILERIVPPTFPDKDFKITDYGAVGDGKTDCTDAFKKAIAATQKGLFHKGGRVVVPAGSFLTGAIHLKSNVNLYVAKDAVIKFSTDPNAYLPAVYTRWEGVECMNYSPLVYAYKQKNIAITGQGTLDGQGQSWWDWKRELQRDDRKRLFEYGTKGVPVKKRLFGGRKLRPNMIEPYKCKNILIEGVTIMDGPFWHLHPVLSRNITIKDVTVQGP